MPRLICPSCGEEWSYDIDVMDTALRIVTLATSLDLVSETVRASRRREQTCPSCLEVQRKQQDDYDSKLQQMMQAWDELDSSSIGLTVSQAIERFRGSPRKFPATRILLFELGSAKHVKGALSMAKGTTLEGRRFENHGRRGDETIWRLVSTC